MKRLRRISQGVNPSQWSHLRVQDKYKLSLSDKHSEGETRYNGRNRLLRGCLDIIPLLYPFK
jgi:hypothetical protein